MKIGASNPVFGYAIDRVQDKSNADGQSGGQKHRDPSQSKKDQEQPEAEFKVDDTTVAQAITSFGSDAQAQLHGLKAEVSGQGPGLKVVLRDGSGTVVRQFTGEEFLKMRAATSKDGRVSGKLLDQKL